MNPITLLTRWFLRRKSAPYLPAASGPVSLDAYRRHRAPTAAELLDELKNTAWSCASINASVCAAHPPRLYVATAPGQAKPGLRTRSVEGPALKALTQRHIHRASLETVEEVVDHPLLDLLRQVNPVHNAFDLWELTQLYLEVHGAAYWLLELAPVLGVPVRIWVLPSHLVRPIRGSDRVVESYEYHGRRTEHFAPERIIHFRVPDPRDPYAAGLSPLRACFEQAALVSDYAAMKRAVYDNAGLPSAIICTDDDQLGNDERQRLETQWRHTFQRGGQGKALVADASLKVTLLSQSMGDLAALADMKATKEDIANAFHVPLPFLSGDTNLANMQAADHLHKSLAILPRLRRRDEKLNEQLVTLFDPSGRLFLASDDPRPGNRDFDLRQEASDLRLGVRTINEVRSTRGLPPVPWGDAPRAT